MKLHHALAAFALATTLVAAADTWVSPTFEKPPHYSWMMGPFRKFSEPIFSPSQNGMDNHNTYNMAVLKDGATIWMLYRGESRKDTAKTNTGRLFLSKSTDGVHFERQPVPVLVCDQPYESRGVEDPRLIKVKGTYYLTYTAYDGKLARLCLATSTDLNHWDKHGPIYPNFAEGNDVSPVGWTKSGAILDQPIAEGPYAGKYIMYFGESDMWMGYSDDLLHWKYVKEPVLRRRPGFGDSRVCEPGPPPIRTREGILLLYAGDDKTRPPFYVTYAALFDPKHPDRLLHRANKPILEPTLQWEQKGYIPNVVFAESLVHVGNHWNLYYGGSDHVIGLAEAPFDPHLLP
jgi:predicted GH43/DUF377 family glycosyl hydrolase